jgi:hypothetical protein
MATRRTATFIEPMLLLRTDDRRWMYELKMDGYRAIAFAMDEAFICDPATTTTSAVATHLS